MKRVFRKAAIRAGLGERDEDGHYTGVTFHDLRHTFASLMIAAGANPLQIAEALGHTDRNGQPDATLVWRRYGHLYPGSSKQAATTLGRYLTAERKRVRDVRGMRESGWASRTNEIPANSRWSVPGSNRRPPACKALLGLAGYAGTVGDCRQRQALCPPACGDLREPPVPSGALLRDVCGMKLLPRCETARDRAVDPLACCRQSGVIASRRRSSAEVKLGACVHGAPPSRWSR